MSSGSPRITSTSNAPDCSGCPLHDELDAPAAIERRDFFRVAGAALASLGLLGLSARNASAMPISAVMALATRRNDTASERRYPIPAADGVSIDKDNSVIIARAEGKVYAFSLACPHQNTALRWSEEDHQFQCPKHHSRYRDDGTFISGRATRNMDRLPVRRSGGELIVDVDTLIQQDEQPAAWTAAAILI